MIPTLMLCTVSIATTKYSCNLAPMGRVSYCALNGCKKSARKVQILKQGCNKMSTIQHLTSITLGVI